MLASTGADWDRRIFRLQVLAEAGARLRFADTWAKAEPRSPHALALLANVQALRAMIAGRNSGWSLMEESWATCRSALEVWPHDVAPLVVMLALLRTHAPDRATLRQVWAEIKQRDPWNREAHHEAVTYLFPRYHGEPGEAMWWAEEQASIAPRGLPIAVLPLVVVAEAHRSRQEMDQMAYGLTIHPWIDCPQIDHVLERWWHYRARLVRTPASRTTPTTSRTPCLSPTATARLQRSSTRSAHTPLKSPGSTAARLTNCSCGTAPGPTARRGAGTTEHRDHPSTYEGRHSYAS
ncbi:hypothetical protein ACSP97_12150 [Streptomyces sp. SCPE 10]|uniref:hypothetical protein n=1 Tax=Streptomyces sp. SCPE 10 TaxID=3449273 RepID=UPI003F7D6C20